MINPTEKSLDQVIHDVQDLLQQGWSPEIYVSRQVRMVPPEWETWLDGIEGWFGKNILTEVSCQIVFDSGLWQVVLMIGEESSALRVRIEGPWERPTSATLRLEDLKERLGSVYIPTPQDLDLASEPGYFEGCVVTIVHGDC